jgi:GNAT superfamily N-acetyltransferase
VVRRCSFRIRVAFRAAFASLEGAPMESLSRISIRCAGLVDLPILRALADTSARALCAADYTAEQIETLLRFGMGVDRQLIADRTYYIVEHGGRIVAGGGWSYRAALYGRAHPGYGGDALDILDAAAHPARIRCFFVHPDVARRGVGRTLLALCQGAAARFGFGAAELMATLTGRRMYRACGYEDVEPITDIFPNGVAAVGYRMRKALERHDFPSPMFPTNVDAIAAQATPCAASVRRPRYPIGVADRPFPRLRMGGLSWPFNG